MPQCVRDKARASKILSALDIDIADETKLSVVESSHAIIPWNLRAKFVG